MAVFKILDFLKSEGEVNATGTYFHFIFIPLLRNVRLETLSNIIDLGNGQLRVAILK